MSARRLRRAAFVAGLLAVGATPLLARALGPPRADRCAFDGARVESGAEVRLDVPAGPRRFCGVGCAERFLESRAVPVAHAWVTDATSGRALPAEGATFVRSAVLANRATGDRVHAFASREEAMRHAAAHHGVLLEGDDRPLRAASGREPVP